MRGGSVHRVRQNLIQRRVIRLPPDARLSQDRLNLRPKQEESARVGIEERPDSKPVPRQKQHLGPGVPDRERPLAIQPPDAILPLLFKQVQDDFRIRARGKNVALGKQLRAKLYIVEDLAVKGDPEGAILVGHRLLSARDIDDAQPGVP